MRLSWNRVHRVSCVTARLRECGASLVVGRDERQAYEYSVVRDCDGAVLGRAFDLREVEAFAMGYHAAKF